jgi:hypothetical protein
LSSFRIQGTSLLLAWKFFIERESPSLFSSYTAYFARRGLAGRDASGMIDTHTSEFGISWLAFLEAPDSFRGVELRRITILVLEFPEPLLASNGKRREGTSFALKPKSQSSHGQSSSSSNSSALASMPSLRFAAACFLRNQVCPFSFASRLEPSAFFRDCE